MPPSFTYAARKFPASNEAWTLTKLALPLALASVAWVAMKTTDTALLGHIPKGSNTTRSNTSLNDGTFYNRTDDVTAGDALAGKGVFVDSDDSGATDPIADVDESYYLQVSSYADLWMSSTSVLVQGQVLGILAGPCLESAQTHLVGIWLQVSLACLSMISIVVMVCFACTKKVLLALPGENITPDMANDAQYFSYVFMGAIPARIMALQLKQYLGCQKIMTPSCVAALVGMAGNIMFGLYFVLGIPSLPELSKIIGAPYGFRACPWVTVSIEWVQPLIVLVMILKLGYKNNGLDTWPSDGWASGHHITFERCRKFLTLYWPAATTIASDFLCVSTVGFIAAQQSPLNVAVFNSSYRILWMCQIFTGALASATGIQVNLAFGGTRLEDAKRSIKVGLTMCLCIIGVLGCMLLQFPSQLASVFSNDKLFLDTFVNAKWTIVLTMMAMNFAICLKTLVMNLGYTKRAFYAGVVGAWGGQVPFVLLLTHFVGNNMIWLYMGVACGYVLLCTVLASLLLQCNWDEVLQMAMERSERQNKQGSARHKLLVEVEDEVKNDVEFDANDGELTADILSDKDDDVPDGDHIELLACKT